MNIRHLHHLDATQVANLHIQSIGGFISSLGEDFVTKLYEGIAASQHGFGVVAEEQGMVAGFVAFTSDISALYKSVLQYGGPELIASLIPQMLSFDKAKNVFQNLFYPFRTAKRRLPKAELLSIVIAPQHRKRGLAVQLVNKGLVQCARRKINQIKVLVATENEPANRLYQKCSFELVQHTISHGTPSNIYVRKIANLNKMTNEAND